MPMETLRADRLKAKALELGFMQCGIAPAHALREQQGLFEQALAEGYQADMHYLEREVDQRFDPESLLEGCRSVVVVTWSYLTDAQPASDQYRTARYTWVEDYHQAVKRQLQPLADFVQQECPGARCRITVDSSRISEKQWAVQSGVGCYGKNGLIHNESGSFFVLGVLLTTARADHYDSAKISDCGDCNICVQSCPAHALDTPYRVDARKCFAYQTVENKNVEDSVLEDSPLLFGCDVCQEKCPRNKKNLPKVLKMSKTSVFLRLQNRDFENLKKEEFKTYFGETAIARRTYPRFYHAIEIKREKSRNFEILTTEKSNILQCAGRVLKEEAEAVERLIQYLDQDFEESVKLILNSKGRLIVTGIGKSAIIGQKIVATLNSTGTPAVFMHAADAVHGDLGIIQPHDVVLCISKSGNTPEITLLTPFLKQNGNKMIAMVGNMNSFLAQSADYVLNCTVLKEATPNNLAPTTSSTAQLAMGDALATALIVERGFTPQDFAKLHPGGSLGKRLTMKVKDLYKFNEKPTVAPDASIQEVILEISGKCLGVTAVLDGEKIVGAITDGDLRRMLQRSADYTHLTAKEVMTTSPKTIHEETLAADAVNFMNTNSITNLFVVDTDNRYLGVIHIHDLIREGLY